MLLRIKTKKVLAYGLHVHGLHVSREKYFVHSLCVHDSLRVKVRYQHTLPYNAMEKQKVGTCSIYRYICIEREREKEKRGSVCERRERYREIQKEKSRECVSECAQCARVPFDTLCMCSRVGESI